ncbi:MAG: (2Fe-2S)-binding protein [Ectothiorhodospiraceae bacterium AqS1]|nr:(2Fe-2S)-binding protein [Ectothiorhodospiraceae bacterium AqS1]
MFKRLPDFPDSPSLTIDFEGEALPARAGESVAAALLAAGVAVFRTTPLSGAPRAPWCMIGECHECLLEIDGEPNRRSCMVQVRKGMRVRRRRIP